MWSEGFSHLFFIICAKGDDCYSVTGTTLDYRQLVLLIWSLNSHPCLRRPCKLHPPMMLSHCHSHCYDCLGPSSPYLIHNLTCSLQYYMLPILLRFSCCSYVIHIIVIVIILSHKQHAPGGMGVIANEASHQILSPGADTKFEKGTFLASHAWPCTSIETEKCKQCHS